MTNQFPPEDQGRPQIQGAGAPAFLWILVGIMAVIEVALSLSEAGYLGSFNWRWPAFAAGAFWQPIFAGAMTPLYPGQRLVMLVTYAFLHGGIVHLAINSVILLSLGKVAVSRIGAAKTLLVLFLSAVGGGLAFGVLSQSAGPMIGASGAVFGLIGLWQAWDYRMRKDAGLPMRPLINGILGLAAANVIFFVILGGGLAWEAHLGGWLAGWVAVRHLSPRKAQC
jgi:membrane associated rhomboid family serine protease